MRTDHNYGSGITLFFFIFYKTAMDPAQFTPQLDTIVDIAPYFVATNNAKNKYASLPRQQLQAWS